MKMYNMWILNNNKYTNNIMMEGKRKIRNSVIKIKWEIKNWWIGIWGVYKMDNMNQGKYK